MIYYIKFILIVNLHILPYPLQLLIVPMFGFLNIFL